MKNCGGFKSLVIPGLLWLLLFNPTLFAQMPVLQKGDIPDLRILSTSHYSDNSLYGYIDGGAEIYREYGFRELVVQEVRYRGEELLVEVYHMASPLAAFGRFSLQRMGCTPAADFPELSCENDYQLTVVLGVYLVSVTNYTASQQARKVAHRIVQKLREQIPEEKIMFPSIFREKLFRPYHKQMVYVAGHLGLRSVAANWEKWLHGVSHFDAFILPLEWQNHSLRVALFRFPDDSTVRSVLSQFSPSAIPGWLTVRDDATTFFAYSLKKSQIFFLETDDSNWQAEEFLKKLRKMFISPGK